MKLFLECDIDMVASKPTVDIALSGEPHELAVALMLAVCADENIAAAVSTSINLMREEIDAKIRNRFYHVISGKPKSDESI